MIAISMEFSADTHAQETRRNQQSSRNGGAIGLPPFSRISSSADLSSKAICRHWGCQVGEIDVDGVAPYQVTGIPADLVYGGFWRRLGAHLIDFFLFVPVICINIVGSGSHYLFLVFSIIPIAAYSLFYSVYLVREFGGTPGKILMNLSIRRVDGTPIGYSEAALRFLPDFGFWLAISVALAIPLLQDADPALRTLDFFEQRQLLTQLAPSWYEPVEMASQIWIWSEFLILLTNKKRRAIHDFIAGTVVVVRR